MTANTKPRRKSAVLAGVDGAQGPSADEVRAAHETPWFNLATEAWIPVLNTDGTLGTVGLQTLLTNAHTIADITESDPLTRAGLRRYLTAIAYLIVKASDQDEMDWVERVEDNTGFTKKEVARLLDEQADYLWLYHPDTPFLQDHRLTEIGPKYGTKAELVPSLPAESENAWFIKPTDPAAIRPLTAAQAARGLVYRWYYSLPGNAGKNLHGSNPGSVFSHVTAPITHIFRVTDTLFTTMLRNIPAHDRPGKTPAWMDPVRPRVSNDWLYNYTLTMAGTVLGPRDKNNGIDLLLRGPVIPNDAAAKDNRTAVRNTDFHQRMILPDTAEKPTILRATPNSTRLEMIRRLKQAEILEHTTTPIGITAPTGPWLSVASIPNESVEVLLATKSGMGSSPVWADSTVIRMPEALFADPRNNAQARLLLTILATCFSPQNGIEKALRTSIFLAHRRMAADGTFVSPDFATVEPFQRLAHREWMMNADMIVADVLATESDAADVARSTASRLADSAVTVFTEQTTTMRTRTASSAAVAGAANFLRGTLHAYLNG